MKVALLVFSCVLCCSSAAFYDALENGCDELVSDFMAGMDLAPSLAEFQPDYAQEAQQIETDVKNHLAEALREVLGSISNHLEDGLKQAHEAGKKLLEKAAEIVGKLKDLQVTGSELGERIREKIRDWVQTLLAKMTVNSEMNYDLVRIPLEFNDQSIMENLRERILGKINIKELADYIKTKLEKLGEVGRALLEALQRPGALSSLKDLLKVLLPGNNPEYGLGDMWGKVRDFFKGVGVKISDKFSLFAAWIKDVSRNGWEKIKDKAGKLKEMAKTVIDKSKTMSRKAAEQALAFFGEHKEEIGQVLWSVLKKALTTAIMAAIVF